MAHGGPKDLGEVEPYLRRVLGGDPGPQRVAELRERYRRIGGRSPLPEITQAQAAALESRLKRPVYVGMRYSAPSIPEAVDRARREGIRRLVGLVLSPYASPFVTGRYHEELRRTGIDSIAVENWHREPAFLQYWRERTEGRDFVLFTAHSLPVILAGPYPSQVAETVSAVASGPHLLAYQSPGRGEGPWLGPTVADVLPRLPSSVAVAAIGFVSDNLEILYDLDLRHREEAESRGIRWERLPMPNVHPLLIEALASAAGRYP